MSELITPGGDTAYPPGPGPDNYRLPAAANPGLPPLRWKDLPPAERIRRKVEDTVRFYSSRHGRVLTADALLTYLHWPPTRREQVVQAMNDPVTVANLRSLGVLPDDVETMDEAAAHTGQPSSRQMDALDAIFERIDPEDKRPLKDILREHGLELKTWNGWLADPVFAGYVRDRAAAVFGQRVHEVDIALLRRGAAGDVQAIKLILELQGRIGRTERLDVNAVLARVVEIIDTEVGDRETKLRIAGRLQALSDEQQRRPMPSGPPVIAGELTAAVNP